VDLELIHLDAGGPALFSLIDTFRDDKEGEEDQREGYSTDRRNLFVIKFYPATREQQHCDYTQPNGNVVAAQFDIEGTSTRAGICL